MTHRALPRTILAFVAITLAVAACGSSDDAVSTSDVSTDAAPTPAGADPAFAGAWQLVAGSVGDEAIELLDEWPISLTIAADDTVSGRAACNSFFGAATTDGSAFSVRDVGQTEMGCEPAVMELEFTFVAALTEVEQARIDENDLVLTGPATELRFRRDLGPPTAALLDTVWELDTLVDDDVAMSIHAEADPATLVFIDETTFVGSTGCRTIAGSYVTQGARILFTDFGAEGECPAHLSDQDNRVISVLGDGFTAEIDGDRLHVTTTGGEGLSYRAS